MIKYLAQQLLPSHCLLCLQKYEDLCCSPCSSDLPWIVNACYNCGIPLKNDQTPLNKEAVCGKCLKASPSYDRCIPAFSYRAPIDTLISKFKNNRDLTAGYVLSALLWKQIERYYHRSDHPNIITPVPLHWRRQLTRSFNQSAFTAQQLSQYTGIPTDNLSKRVIATPKQQRLNRSQRLQNLKGTFKVNAQKVEGKHIAIIDDVVTTGATIEALSAEFKKAGANRVDVWCISRTPERTHR